LEDKLGNKLGRDDPDGRSCDWFGIAVGLKLGTKLGRDEPDGRSCDGFRMAVGLKLGTKLGRVDPDGSSWDWFGIVVGLELGSKLGSDDPDGCCSWFGKTGDLNDELPLGDTLSKNVGCRVSDAFETVVGHWARSGVCCVVGNKEGIIGRLCADTAGCCGGKVSMGVRIFVGDQVGEICDDEAIGVHNGAVVVSWGCIGDKFIGDDGDGGDGDPECVVGNVAKAVGICVGDQVGEVMVDKAIGDNVGAVVCSSWNEIEDDAVGAHEGAAVVF
jgi:hypothetical protein